MSTATEHVSRLVTTEVNGFIATVGISHGPLNLVTTDLLRELNEAFSAVSAMGDIRCVILHGSQSRAFCAGSDIKEFARIREQASEKKILFEDMVLRQLARLPMPTIAAIDGAALGGWSRTRPGLRSARGATRRGDGPDRIASGRARR